MTSNTANDLATLEKEFYEAVRLNGDDVVYATDKLSALDPTLRRALINETLKCARSRRTTYYTSVLATLLFELSRERLVLNPKTGGLDKALGIRSRKRSRAQKSSSKFT